VAIELTLVAEHGLPGVDKRTGEKSEDRLHVADERGSRDSLGRSMASGKTRVVSHFTRL